jgi:hypothetical protein
MPHPVPRFAIPLPWVAGCIALAFGPSALAPIPAAAQGSAVLHGLVADETGRLIGSATITLLGSGIETTSAADGAFTFQAAPLGRVLVRVRAAGYPTIVEQIDVTQDSLFVPVFLPDPVVVLDEILVTTPGTDPPHAAQAQTAADLLTLHLPALRPGVTFVQPRGTAPTRLGLRGPAGTFTRGGEPTIVLDGARLRGGIEVLRQIPAAHIKSIRVLKGPTAAFHYGSAEGVIYIQTVSGPPPP